MIEIVIDPEPAAGDLNRIADRIADPSDLVQQVGERQLEFIEEGYAGERDPDGAAWAALAESTLRQKKGPSILTEEGTGRGSYSLSVSGNSGEITNSDDKMKYHQSGTSRMPARVHMGFGARHVQEHEEIGLRWLESILG